MYTVSFRTCPLEKSGRASLWGSLLENVIWTCQTERVPSLDILPSKEISGGTSESSLSVVGELVPIAVAVVG